MDGAVLGHHLLEMCLLEDGGGRWVLPEVDLHMRGVPPLTAVRSPASVLMAGVEGRHGRPVS